MKTRMLSMLLCLSSLVACTTEVDLCHGEHPHRVDLQAYFDFGDFPTPPDSMVVFAVRNLNLLRYTYHLNTRGRMKQAADGCLVYPDTLREPLDEKGHDRICLHPGDYELVAFSGGSDIYYDNLEEVMDRPAEMVDSLWVTHHSYHTTRDHPLLADYNSWVSHNIYTDFILNGDREPTFSAQETLSVPVSENPLTQSKVFNAHSLSQHITLEFRIKKEAGITILGAVAELSGIAHRLYLMTGAVDVSRTFKTMLRPVIEPQDNTSATEVTVRGEVHVNGLIRSADPTYTTGPGILWISVDAQAVRDDGTVATRPIEACINLYHLLQENPSLRLNERDEAQQTTKELFLSVPDAILDVTRWELVSQETSGLDVWRTLPNEEGNVGVDL